MEDEEKSSPAAAPEGAFEEPNTSLDVGKYSLQKAHVSLGGNFSHSRKKYVVDVRVLEKDDPLIEEGYIDSITRDPFAQGDKIYDIETDGDLSGAEHTYMREASFFFMNSNLKPEDFTKVEEPE